MKYVSFIAALSILFIPLLPAQDAKTLEFKTFVKDTDEANSYLFTMPSDIAFDKDQSVYILDISEHMIFKFDVNGKFIKTIGKKGEGPGEMQFPLGIAIKDNILYLIDGSTAINTYDLNGESIASKQKDFTPVQNVKAFPQVFFIGGDYDAEDLSISLCKYNWQGKKTDVLDSLSYKHYFTQKDLSTTRNMMMQFVEGMIFDINSKGEILFAKSNKYEIKKFFNGKTKVLISEEREAKKRPDMNGYEKKIKRMSNNIFLNLIGDSYYLVNSLMTDAQDNIWFFTSSKDRTGIVKYSPEGKFLSFYKVALDYLKEGRFFISKDYIYCIYISKEKIEILRAEIPVK